MASTNDNDDGSEDGGGITTKILDFLKEPLGMGLAAGIGITLALGYYILY